MLRVDQLSKQFGGLRAVDCVDLTVNPREIVSIIGPNGAGKTTLFNCLTGVYAPTTGRITFAGQEITGWKPHAIARRGIGRTFQNIRLFAEMSALENVMAGMFPRTTTGVLGAICRPSRVRREETRCAEEALAGLRSVGLETRWDVWARHLAYGDQRRLEIARALATNPQLLLLDEPAAGMNPQEVGALMELIRQIRDRGVTVVLIEHHMKVVTGISDRILVLDHGEKIAEGTPQDVCNNPQVIAAYLGSAATSA